MRQRPAAGGQMIGTGTLTTSAQVSLRANDPPQRVARHRAALDVGRATRAFQRDRVRSEESERLTELGFADLAEYLRAAYPAGAGLDELARATGLGRQRLRAALDEAGVDSRPPGQNVRHAGRDRAAEAEGEAAHRVGTTDLPAWLRDRYAAGWPLTRLAAAVGHSTHWVRWRLEPAEQAS